MTFFGYELKRQRNVVSGAHGVLAECRDRAAAGDFIATGDIRISSWGSRCIVCCERGGLRHPSILRASAGRLRRRLTSDRSVRTQGRDWRKVALSVSEREKSHGSITSYHEGRG